MEDNKFKIDIFRYSSVKKDQVVKVAAELAGNTTYRRTAFREEAPSFTDCLTSIHYIFKKALGIDIPVTFIGDMPRRLLSRRHWSHLKIKIEDAQCGDILFVKNKENIKLLSHVAMVIERNKIFHCCPTFGTAVIQSKDAFFLLYDQTLNFEKMIRYIDPRNKKLREVHQGVFISN